MQCKHHLNEPLVQWMLEGDVSIQYQVYRDLLCQDKKSLQGSIARTGWGARLLRCQHKDGHWGRGFYQPKWVSTHYTLLDLKNLGLPQTNRYARHSIASILSMPKSSDGGIYPFTRCKISDVCINGMFLNYASYFGAEQDELRSVVNFLLTERMADGGFNCNSNQCGATHSSVHSTLSVIEGIRQYEQSGCRYRLDELLEAEIASQEFLLVHKLYQSHRTGVPMDKKMLMLSYPSRWRYDILRALDYFRWAEVRFDTRMQDAIDVLLGKRRKDGTWPLQAKHPGRTHFDYEKPGQPSRWNTLRALRVLDYFVPGWEPVEI